MKNKKTAYILVPIVLAVWGMIGWKVYAAMQGKEEMFAVVVPDEKVKPVGADVPDTITLIADYRDPFLGGISIKENFKFEILNSKLKTAKVPDQPKDAIVWPSISYHGLVKKNGGEKVVGFLNVGGESFFVRGGEVVGEIQVGKLWKDSVEILFGKEKRVFRK